MTFSTTKHSDKLLRRFDHVERVFRMFRFRERERLEQRLTVQSEDSCILSSMGIFPLIFPINCAT